MSNKRQKSRSKTTSTRSVTSSQSLFDGERIGSKTVPVKGKRVTPNKTSRIVMSSSKEQALERETCTEQGNITACIGSNSRVSCDLLILDVIET